MPACFTASRTNSRREMRVNTVRHQKLRVFRPTIASFGETNLILPERFLDAEPANQLEAALAHEWAHICNRDLWLIALVRLLLPVLFAHPGYWWLRRRIRDDQELLAKTRVEQDELIHLVLRVESMPADGADFEAAVLVLAEHARQHMRREEEGLFACLRHSGLDLLGTGERMASLDAELATTPIGRRQIRRARKVMAGLR